MHKARIPLLVLLSAAGAAGGIWMLAHLPLGVEIVPAWISALLPPPGTAGAGWFALTVIGIIVVTAVALPFVGRTPDDALDGQAPEDSTR